MSDTVNPMEEYLLQNIDNINMDYKEIINFEILDYRKKKNFRNKENYSLEDFQFEEMKSYILNEIVIYLCKNKRSYKDLEKDKKEFKKITTYLKVKYEISEAIGLKLVTKVLSIIKLILINAFCKYWKDIKKNHG